MLAIELAQRGSPGSGKSAAARQCSYVDAHERGPEHGHELIIQFARLNFCTRRPSPTSAV
jgi:hypothetical protein